MSKWTRSAIGTLVGLLAALPVWAQWELRERNVLESPFWERDQARVALGLTDEQVGQLGAHWEAMSPTPRELRARLEKAEADLERLLEPPEPDEEAVEKMARRVGDLRGKLFRKQVRGRLAFKKILTPQQQRRLLHLLGEGGEKGRGDQPWAKGSKEKKQRQQHEQEQQQKPPQE